MYLSALNINQTIDLKKNGSGVLTVSYIAVESEIKSKNFQIGSFPFLKEKIDEYFKSASTVVYSSTIGKAPKDAALTQVTVILGFNNILKLNEMKAFSDIKISILETDSGSVLRYVFPQSFIKMNNLENAYITMKSERNIKSSNAKITDNSVTFFRGKEFINGKSDINFVVTLESPENKKTSDSKDSDDKDKGCGLFGLELPLIMLAGLVFSFNSRKNRSKV